MITKFKMDSFVTYKNTVYKVFSAERTDNGPIYYNLFPLISNTAQTTAISVDEKYLKKWDGKVNQ